ncbi:flagellar biosynthetic protein FliO [Thiorhodovibrio frisius]|uniref:Flagellar protein n=1 Tax=Thiorhodovibrio frisius TaxID=631362 RepID=H8YZL9_9GAMM|nr:flagellar biosynthetic protein FliO [Thiorhodovibrio frisius]EIC22146.1 flagellar biosynthetic protein FliO [Thiorhodovibrio frisius]WPL24440.1 Flagellar protein FliO [Thiorhodovibrio frisius]
MRTRGGWHRFGFLPLAALLCALVAQTLQASEPATGSAPPATGGYVTGSYGAGGYLAQLIGGLTFVVIAILVFAWFMRRFSGTSSAGIPRAIEILAVRSVGTRERLMLVKVGEEQVLIGVSPAGMRTLHRLETPLQPPPSKASSRARSQNPEETPAGDKAEPKTGVDFASLLRKQMSKITDA